ncbi:carbonic anhydrase [Pelagibius litoralis]|uniref:Carbonic anhydrase n=1 Tax=Pelagibius litoralis TaxID=374515 RepID=A0A967KG30_9PROT|nr:carbonic anhydrase [Pelagibius litoralis]NIA70021.1 carbonic anhydrase [Pelagibius litoralis]
MVQTLIQRNIHWATERVEQDPDYFKRLSDIQNPRYLWIGCSDSRVPANVIAGLEPGEVFVHRNVANLLHPGDLNGLSVLQYAVESLQVRQIIVCGHYGCGGINAAVEAQRHGLIDHWLQPIRDTAALCAGELENLGDQTQRMNRLCELNVMAQVKRVAETPIVQDAWGRGQALEVHGLVYGLNDGRLRNLDCSLPATAEA